MIETQKKTIDIEEFSPTEPIYQENVIRNLVRLASLIIIGLLGVSVVQKYIPDFEVYTKILSPMLIFALMIVFFAGIILAFFQLRWVNEKRNKSTNLGGTVGLFGLFLTLISSVSSLIAIPLVILIPLLGLGLLLTLVGFFAEMTRIDEPLVFWFRVNLEVIIRYTITITGALLVNWSALMIVSLFLVDWGVLTIFVWPGDLIGGLVIGGIGIVLVWGSWFHQINQTIWRYRVEIVRSIELSVSQGLIVFALIVPFFDPTSIFLSSIFGITGLAIFYLDLYLFKVKVTSQFSKGFVTFSQVIASIIGFLLIIIGIIQSIPDRYFFSIYFPVTGLLLLYRVWFDNINHTVKRTIQTIVWFFRTYYREVITIFGVGLMTIGFMGWTIAFEVAVLLFFVGYLLSVVIWHLPSRHVYFRGTTTTLSAVIFCWGFVSFVLSDRITQAPLIPPLFISVLFIGSGCVVPVVLWRVELAQLIRQTIAAVVAAIVQTSKAIWHFLETYYPHLVTIVGVGLMTIGFMGWTIAFEVAVLLFFVGYLLSVVIWHLPSRHVYFRGTTTTLSAVIFCWGFVSFVLSDRITQAPLIPPLLISVLFVGSGCVVPVVLWRVELAQLIRQTIAAVVAAVVQTSKAIWHFLVTYYPHLITTIGLGLMVIGFVGWFVAFEVASLLFFMGYLLGVVIWHLPSRHEYFRGVVTTLSAVIFCWGFFSLVLSAGITPAPLIPPLLISVLFVGSGCVVPVVLWRVELAQLIRQIIAAVVAAVVQTSKAIWHFLETYYQELVTIIGLGLMVIGFVGWFVAFEVASLLFFMGYLLGFVIWHLPSRHEYFRGVATTLSVLIFCWGFFSFILSAGITPAPLIPPLLVSVLFIGFGCVVPVVLWRVELAQLMRQIIAAVVAAVVQTVEAIARFLSSALTQLGRLLTAIIDSVIPIILGAISVTVILYGFFVLIYAIIKPIGEFLDGLLIQVPPIAFIASFIQQEAYNRTLIGVFENLLQQGYGLFVIAVAIIFIVVGVMLLLIVVLKKEGMQLKSILKTSKTQDSPKSGTLEGDVFESSKKGD